MWGGADEEDKEYGEEQVKNRRNVGRSKYILRHEYGEEKEYGEEQMKKRTSVGRSR